MSAPEVNNDEGSPTWRAGIEACIRKVKYRQSVMPSLQHPAYKTALVDLLVHFEAMLVVGKERTGGCVVDGGGR
jgi:hypothetical protein